MSGWRVSLWRRNARGDWFEIRSYPGEKVAEALEEANRRNAAGPDLHVVLPVGEIPTT